MGWSYTRKPTSVSQWFKDMLTWETVTAKNTCLKTCVRSQEAYAAVETINKATGERMVWAAVFLLDCVKSSDGFDFGFKDMDETVGPYVANCPETILKLLTPTENEQAKDWRQSCWQNIESKKQLPKYGVGDTLRFKEPIQFAEGFVLDEFTCIDKRKRHFKSSSHPTVIFQLLKQQIEMREYEVLFKESDKIKGGQALLPFA